MSLYHTIEYTFGQANDEYEFDYTIVESVQDYFEYMFENKYNMEYRPTAWYLEKGAKDMRWDLENKWLHNQLDLSYAYEHDYNFRDYLKRKYECEAEKEFKKDFGENYTYIY